MTRRVTDPASWRQIIPPPRLRPRPRDTRGFVIPYSVDDGTDQPDFRVTRIERVRELLTNDACWLCGQRLDRKQICFIGGPRSISNRVFSDGPMHEACAVYALRVCPFLANPKGRYTSDVDDPRLIETMASTRPERFGLGFTARYRPMLNRQGQLLLVAAPWRRVRWYSAWGEIIGTGSSWTGYAPTPRGVHAGVHAQA